MHKVRNPIRQIIAVLLLAGCASWAPTREAGVRRVEASRLRGCVQYNCQFTQQCIRESVERCRAQGLEATCGSDEIFTQEPIRCRP